MTQPRDSDKPDDRLARRGVIAFGSYALAGAILTLTGWFGHAPGLTDWLGTGIAMFPNAALAALCAATALLLGRKGPRWTAALGDLLGLAVVLLGGATLFQHLSGVNLGIDLILIPDPSGSRAAIAPGRMGPPASTSFTLIGLAILLARGGGTRRAVPVLGIAVSAIAMLSLIGYLFGADPLFSVARFTGIAMQTATILMALGLGAVASVPEYEPMRFLGQDSAAGLLARRSVPFVIGLPILLGWIGLWGQRAGLVDTGLGTALLVLTLIAVLCGLLWWCVRAVGRREEALREREAELAQLAAIVECSPDAIVSKSFDGIVSSWNPGAKELFGFSKEEMVGKPIRQIIPADCLGEEDEILRRLRVGETVRDYETTWITKAGVRVPVSLTVSPIKDASGKIIRASTVIHDITERKQAEAELARARMELEQSNRELEKRVQQRTAALQEMVAELQHVAYAMVHDMRAPLRAMNAFAQFLLEETPADGLSEAREYCHRIIAAAARLDKLIQDALGYTKAVLEQVPLEPVDLHALVRTLIETYPNLQAERADIEIAGTLPTVLGSESLLTQCFSNLLGNAVKFVVPGTRPRVRIEAQEGDGVVRIWVKDNGIGIPAHAQQRLFGMFERLTKEYEGTGIGLAIVRKVAERMSGKVGVESEPDRGSHFWVELRPVQTTDAPPSEPCCNPDRHP